jgi:hypothetical protein
MVSFFLWGNGGPNRRREFALFQEEEANSWVVASSKPRPRSFAEVVKSPPLTGANAVPMAPRRPSHRSSQAPARCYASAPARRSVFDRVLFPPVTDRVLFPPATGQSAVVRAGGPGIFLPRVLMLMIL